MRRLWDINMSQYVLKEASRGAGFTVKPIHFNWRKKTVKEKNYWQGISPWKWSVRAFLHPPFPPLTWLMALLCFFPVSGLSCLLLTSLVSIVGAVFACSFFFKKYLFIWLCKILVAHMSWDAGSSSLTRDQPQAPALGTLRLGHWITREDPLPFLSGIERLFVKFAGFFFGPEKFFFLSVCVYWNQHSFWDLERICEYSGCIKKKLTHLNMFFLRYRIISSDPEKLKKNLGILGQNTQAFYFFSM